jgi:hypothetical protein
MPRNATLHLEMVESAAQFLSMRAPQAAVPEAMRVARFLEDNIANPNIKKTNPLMPAWLQETNGIIARCSAHVCGF